MIKKLKKWFMQGSENDKYYVTLSVKDKYYYQIGLKLFISKFWYRNNLNKFTDNKTGKDYVQGIVDRGKWLRKKFYWRSSIFNMIDFYIMIPKMIGTGPDPESRIIILKIIDFFKFM
jgi:hypothetical protein